jgi:hypothetical protein
MKETAEREEREKESINRTNEMNKTELTDLLNFFRDWCEGIFKRQRRSLSVLN